jgi:hypothetical protein
MYYFPTSLGRAYVDGTNLRMSYCQFPTVLFGPCCSRIALGVRRRRRRSLRKNASPRSSSVRRRAICDARSMRDGLVTGGDWRRSQHATRSGYGWRAIGRRSQHAGRSWLLGTDAGRVRRNSPSAGDRVGGYCTLIMDPRSASSPTLAACRAVWLRVARLVDARGREDPLVVGGARSGHQRPVDAASSGRERA